MARIHVPPDLKESENVVGAHEEGSADRAIRHDYRPPVRAEKIDQARDKLADGTLHAKIVNHVVSDGEPEDGTCILIARSISNPDVSRRAIGVDAIGRF